MGETANEIVKLILSLSVSGGLFALALFALKPVMRNKLSKSFQYYIWFVVLLRFVLPFSFGINLMDFTIRTPNTQQMSEETVIPSNNSADPKLNPVANNNSININNPNITVQQPSASVSSNSTKPFDIMKTLADNLLWIWLTGAVISAAFYVLGFLRFIRHIHDAAYTVEIPICGAKIYKSRFAPTPMLVGVIRPRIYLPDIEFTDEQLNNILLHELTHLRRRDVWLKWFATFVVSLHWFNPIVYFMGHEFSHACELSCDEAVIRNLDNTGKQSYGDTLISVVAESRYPIGAMSTTMCEEKKKLKERLVAIMNYRKKTKIAVLITAVLAVAITVSVFAFGPVMKKASQAPPEIKITAGSVELLYALGINQWDGNIYDREDCFERIMSGTALADLEYVKNGETITILVDGNVPDSVTLTEYILKDDGTKKYNIEGMSYDISFGVSNQMGTLTLVPNYTAGLSSLGADYDPGATIRGFQLVCLWGENECEYSFIIRSDALDTLSYHEEQNDTESYSISFSDLRQLAAKGDELTFEDFNDYKGQEVGSGLYILHFEIEGGYSLLVGGGNVTGKPDYANLSITDFEENIDIRYDDIDEFINK